MAVRSEYFRSYHLPVLSAEQNDSQSEEINVIDESQAGNRPVFVREAEIGWKKSFLGRLICLLCLAAAPEITHAVHSLYVPVRGVACKGGLCFHPSRRVARLAGHPPSM